MNKIKKKKKKKTRFKMRTESSSHSTCSCWCLWFFWGLVTVNSDQPEVEIYSDIVNVGAETGKHRILTCRARGFNTSDIILNFKKNHCVLTKEDGVETSGVKPDGDTFWRRDRVIIPQSEVSYYSCEVVHAASRFRVEKVWDPEYGAKGRNIEFIDTTPPDVEMFTKNSADETNIMLTCLVSGFYPNNIIMNMKRNGTILTREDGVKSSRVCSNKDDTFQRRDSVEIEKSDKSDFSCEVIHDASGSRVEKFWDHQLPPPDDFDGDNTAVITGPVVGGVLLLVLVVVLVVLRRRGVLGAPADNPPVNYTSGGAASPDPPSGANGVKAPLVDGEGQAAEETTKVVVDPQSGTKESKTSVNRDNISVDSGVDGPQPGDADSRGSLSGFSTSSTVAASTVPPSGSPDSGNVY